MYKIALAEIHTGRKNSHWIWYVFPQLKGLGVSSYANFYGLASIAEAQDYLRHALMDQRLKEAVVAMLVHRTQSASSILGEIDALKFRSCLTLFSLADPAEKIFCDALECFFNNMHDSKTLSLLKARGDICASSVR